MNLSPKSQCLIATPISHLPEVHRFVKANHNHFKLLEKPSRTQVIDEFQNNSNLKYIFVNPNAQGYYIDSAFLEATNVLGINTCSTGTNHIDLLSCTKKQIQVYSLTTDFELINKLPSTAELAFGMLISLCRSIIIANRLVVDDNCWDYTTVMGRQIGGMTVGILGFGRLGSIFAKLLGGFGAKILICENDPSKEIPTNATKVDIKTLFNSSDAVSIHIHSNEANQNLIGAQLINSMKKDSFLINTSRGDVCDEQAIAESLLKKRLGGYATDVLSSEFDNIQHSPIHKLAKQKLHNIVITPHVGGMTYEGQTKAFLYALNKFTLD